MIYKSMSIYFMSGTGNSFRAATWMKEIANKKNIKSKLSQISRIHEKPALENDASHLIGVVFPTHGFTIIRTSKE